MKTVAGILVGGASRRMGRPKALLRADGVTLIERTAAVAREAADEVVLLGRPPFELPAALHGMAIIHDLHPGIGPIGGLEALLAARAGCAVLLLACDMPRITANLLRRLQSNADAEPVVFVTPGEPPQRHPCCALYPPSAAATVTQHVAAGRYAMMDLLDAMRPRSIPLAPAEADLLHNANRPQDADGLG